MPFTVWMTLGILILLQMLSVRLAYSGFFAGREYAGWILFGVILLIYIPFVAAWYRAIGEVSGWEILYIIFLAVLILPLGFLGAELVTLILTPDPSKGLETPRVHTEAEKKVAADDLNGAIEEYERIIAKSAHDMAARLRLADLCNEAHQYEKAARAYESLVSKPKGLSVDQHCSVLTRLSEIYARHLGEKEKACATVQEIIDRYPDSDYANFARERLKNL